MQKLALILSLVLYFLNNKQSAMKFIELSSQI